MRTFGGHALRTALAVLLAATPAAAQSPPTLIGHSQRIVRVNDGTIDGTRIQPYRNTWVWMARAADGTTRTVGRWEDAVRMIHRDGEEILHRLQSVHRPDEPTVVHTQEARRGSLAPLFTTVRRGSDPPHIEIRFAGRRITARHPLTPHARGPAAGVPVGLELTTPEPVFDWRLWGLLVAAMPLDSGYAASFLAYSSEPPVASPLLWVTVRVTGREVIVDPANGSMPCHVVEVDAGVRWRFWIATERDGPPIRQIRILQPDGSEHWWLPAGGSLPPRN